MRSAVRPGARPRRPAPSRASDSSGRGARARWGRRADRKRPRRPARAAVEQLSLVHAGCIPSTRPCLRLPEGDLPALVRGDDAAPSGGALARPSSTDAPSLPRGRWPRRSARPPRRAARAGAAPHSTMPPPSRRPDRARDMSRLPSRSAPGASRSSSRVEGAGARQVAGVELQVHDRVGGRHAAHCSVGSPMMRRSRSAQSGHHRRLVAAIADLLLELAERLHPGQRVVPVLGLDSTRGGRSSRHRRA